MTAMTGPPPNRDQDANRLAATALAAGDPTGWFERLYVEAEHGTAVVPWDRGVAHPALVEWADRSALDGAGRAALVVGAGYGTDAVHLAGLGFSTIAFDIAPTAVSAARTRWAGSTVEFVVADLLDPRPDWSGAFDLVLESYTVQSMPLDLRSRATQNVASFVAPGGTLLVLAAGRPDHDQVPPGPPWPLSRAEIDAFGTDGLTPVAVEELSIPSGPLWRVELVRR